MTTGLFPIRRAQGGPRKGYIPKNRRQSYQEGRRALTAKQLAAFAEALSRHDLKTGDHGGSVTKAATAIGVSQQRGSQLLARMIAELGWQAQ